MKRVDELNGARLKGLRRFVTSIGENCSFDDDGFLDPASSHVWMTGVSSTHRPVNELVGVPVSFVLLGAGGAGKTTTLGALALAEGAQYVDLAADSRIDLQAALGHAITQGRPVFLDAVDQFAGSASAPLRTLSRDLGAAAKLGVRLRLGCRTALWKESFADSLGAMLPGFEQLVLLPLDRVTATDIVSMEKIDGPGFIDALIAAKRGRLSASPQRLIAAARYWHANGELADSGRAAIEFEIAEFLAEYDDERPQVLPAKRAWRIAQRLAAVSTFTDTTVFAPGPSADRSMSVSALPPDAEPDEPGFAVTPHQYGHVLATTLFEAAAPGKVRFRHQQYAEYLAASYLLDRGLSERRVLRLLDVHANGLLPAARVGVAAWLTALEPELIPHLAADNAVALIHSGIEIQSDAVRAALVEALFRHVAERGLAVEWELDLSVVVHPGLAEQLIQQIEAEAVGDLALWWVARLAIAGNCTELAGRLAALAGERTRAAWIRRHLVRVVALLGDQIALESLRALLPLGAGEDPDCELAGALVDVLYPQLISVDEVLPLLELQPASGDPAASPRTAMHRLADRVPAADLPAFLAWLAAQPRDYSAGSMVDELYVGLMRAAWNLADDPQILDALAAMLATTPQSGRWMLHQHRSDPLPWNDEHTARRRALTTAVIRHLDEQAWFTLIELRLIGSADALWLLDELPAMPPGKAAALAPVVNSLLGAPSAQLADRVLSLDASHPAYGLTEWCRQSVSTEPSPDDPWRLIASGEKARASTRAQQIKALLVARQAAWAKARADVEAWWAVADLLSFDEDAQAPDGRFIHDLTHRPGWALLADEERQWLIDRGIAYLATHQPRTEMWASAATVELDTVLPDWSGLYLMATLLLHAPEKLQALDEQTWRRWIGVVVAAWGSGDSGDAVRAQLLRAATPAVRQHAANAALEQLDARNATERFLSPYSLYQELIPDLAPVVAPRLAEGRYTGELAAQVLQLLVEGTPAVALEVCRAIAGREDSPLCQHARQHLARLEPNTAAETLPPDRQALTAQAGLLIRIALTDLDDGHLANLAELLLDAYPYHQDPPLRYGVHTVQPADDVRRVRDAALSQLADRGLPDTIASLRANRPTDAEVLLRIERRARERQADHALTPISPDALFALLRRGDSRLVRDDADLAAVVLEALDILQRSIIHDGAFHDLWDGSKPKSEDDISDWIRRALHHHFDRGLIIDRENQVVRYKPRGSGTRIDLTATVPTATARTTLARVILEAKRLDNTGLERNLLDQLDRRYLVPTGLRHGIYLVYWVTPDQRPAGWTTKHPHPTDLHKLLAAQAATASPGLQISPYILDISRPGA